MAFGVDEANEKSKGKKLPTFQSLFLSNAQVGVRWVVAVCHLRWRMHLSVKMHRTSDHKSMDALELPISLPLFITEPATSNVCLICWWMTCINTAFSFIVFSWLLRLLFLFQRLVIDFHTQNTLVYTQQSKLCAYIWRAGHEKKKLFLLKEKSQKKFSSCEKSCEDFFLFLCKKRMISDGYKFSLHAREAF